MTCRRSSIVCAAVSMALTQGAAAQTVLAPQSDAATLRAHLANAMAPPGRAMPADANDLDAMLRSGDFVRLSARLRSPHTAQDLDLDMNWAQTRIFDGAGFLVAYGYMNDLWRLASALPASAGDELKQSAGMIFLYIFDLARVDGSRCADVSAPGHRIDQLFQQNPALIAYLRGLPEAARMQLGTISLDIETATAALRQNDPVLCSGGLDQITQGLKAQGDKPLPQVPNAPGTLGKTYAVPAAPGYKPAYVDAAVWQPKAAAARSALPATLTRLLSQAGGPPAAPAGK